MMVSTIKFATNFNLTGLCDLKGLKAMTNDRTDFRGLPPAGVPLNRYVSDDLLGRLRSGEFEAGDKLPGEAELMSAYGVGRNTVREAVHALVAMRLVDIRPRRGAIVLETPPQTLISKDHLITLISKETTEDLYEMRMLLETEAAAMAARNASDQQIDELGRLLAVQETRLHHEPGGWREDLDFHEGVARASGNSVLPLMLGAAADLLSRDREASSLLKGEAKVAFEQHRSVFQAISQRDADAARTLMATHIKTASQYRYRLDSLKEGQ